MRNRLESCFEPLWAALLQFKECANIAAGANGRASIEISTLFEVSGVKPGVRGQGKVKVLKLFTSTRCNVMRSGDLSRHQIVND
jgi:hypothetical protein